MAAGAAGSCSFHEGRSCDLNAIAIIPARGGSKGVPGKNLRPLCGKPLITWSIQSALKARNVGRVVVSTDDTRIAEVSRAAGAEVVWRPAELSGDEASSEAALRHALEALEIHEGPMAFLQCTSPLILPEDIDGTLALLARADSAFTATPSHRFLWREVDGEAVAVGHSKGHRPRRQDMHGEYIEVGAVYAIAVELFRREWVRFAGRTAIYPIPAERSLEIDSETDLILAEGLMRRRLQAERARVLPHRVMALVTDFDGVLTDNRVFVDERGMESVACHRGDGWAVARLQEEGVAVLVLTNERNPAVAARCRKLGVPCIVTGDKPHALKQWLSERCIPAENAVYVGNDLPDVPCMLHVGCGVAPADARPEARSAARLVLESPGGHGCLRELFDLLQARNGGIK